VGQRGNRLQGERGMAGRVGHEPGDGLGHDTAFLCPGAALDQHFQIELLGCQPFQRILADGAEPGLVNIVQQPVFEVSIAN